MVSLRTDQAQALSPNGTVPEETEIDGAYLLSETSDHEGHAASTLYLYPDRFAHNDSHGWLKYVDTHWKTTGAQKAVERALTETLKLRRRIFSDAEQRDKMKRSWGNRQNVNGTRDQLRKFKEIEAPINQFDNEPGLLNVANGVLDLKTGELMPHGAHWHFTYCLPVPYIPGTVSKEWLPFIESSVNHPDTAEFLRYALGYSLTGYTQEEAMFYLYGPTRSGKGVAMETTLRLLGEPLGKGVTFRMFTADRSGDTQSFDLAPLKPARFVTASESSKYSSLNPAVVKQVTGGDDVYCAFKHRTHFSYRPQYKIWLTSNWPLDVDVDDDAAWGRVRVVNFPHSHLGAEDKTLKQRLQAPDEMIAILAWMVSGAIDWHKNGMPAPASVTDVTAKHRAELDYIQQFLDEICNVDTTGFTTCADMYQAYSTWCEENGYPPKYQRQFGRSLTAKGYASKAKKVKGATKKVYLGLALKW